MAEFVVDEGFTVGLRNRADQRRNQQRLADLQGLIPTEEKLRQLPVPLYPLENPPLGGVLSWPHPRFFMSGKQLLLAAETALYRVATDWTATEEPLYKADAPTVESAAAINSTNWAGSGWTVNNDAATASHTSGTTDLLAAASTITATKMYRVRIGVSSYSAGTVTPKLGTAAGSAITGIGKHIQYIVCTGTTPKIALTPSNDFVGTIDEISVMEVETAVPTEGGGVWHHAAFGEDIWFLTSGKSLIYSLPSEGCTRLAETRLLVNTLVNANQRLVFGGMSGTHFSTSQWRAIMEKWRLAGDADYRRGVTTIKDQTLDQSWFAFSQSSGGAVDYPFVLFLAMFGYPSVDFYEGLREPIDTALEQADMGLFPLKHGGSILAALQLGLDTVFYTNKGISRINWTDFGPSEVEVLDMGIAGRGAVAGNDRIHVWISKQMTAHMWILGEGIDALDYREFLSVLDKEKLVINMDILERYFSISDGEKGFWLTRTGLAKSDDIMPTTLLRFPGAQEPYDGLLGAGIEAEEPGEAVVETDIFDAGERGTWELIKVGLATTDTNAAGWVVQVLWRINKSEDFVATTPIVLDDRGIAYTKAPGTEWKVRLTHPDRTKCDLDRLDIYFRNTATGKISVSNIWERI